MKTDPFLCDAEEMRKRQKKVMDMYNICRPFVLHNDFLPPSEDVHRDWGYLSYGYYDGVSVGENLFEKGKVDLRRMWKYTADRGAAMMGRYQEQVVYGFRSDKDKNRERNFWSEDRKAEYPFLFISLLQLKSKDNQKAFCEKCKKLERALTDEQEGYQAITYLTLDNSDLLLVLLSKRYLSGMNIVENLHRGDGKGAESISRLNWSLCYSFTVASLYKKALNGEIDLEEECLPFVYIYAIEKSPGSVDCIYNLIKEEIGDVYLGDKKQSTLGCNDELIVLKDIPWSKFRVLYQDESGILNHSNQVYQKHLVGLTTIIGKPNQIENKGTEKRQEGRPSGLDSGTASGSGKQITLSSVLRKEFGELPWMKDTDLERFRNLKKDLFQVLNTLQRFETTPFPDYVFRTLLVPLHMIKKIMEKTEKMEEIDALFESFYSWFKGISLYAQNSIKSDRQFTQSLDYNIRIYQTPVKLNAFYNAYVYNLKEYLNSLEKDQEVQHHYEFMACPGMTDNMQVQELFASLVDTEKLFIVSIPENQMYDIHLMLVMLSHEVGHFVGKEIRNRPRRVEWIEKILSRIMVKYYRISIQEQDIGAVPEEYWQGLEIELKKRINTHFERQKQMDYIKQKYLDITEEECKKLKQELDEFGVYSRVLNQLLQDCVEEVLTEESEELFSFLLQNKFDEELEKNGLKEAEKSRNILRSKLDKVSGDWLGYSPWNSHTTTLPAAMELVLENFKECVADIIGIVTLKLSMLDYLKSILQSAKDQGREAIQRTEALVRCSLVTYCMIRSEDGLGFCWEDGDIRSINELENEDIMRFKDCICGFLDYHFAVDRMSTEMIQNVDDYKRSAVNTLYDSIVLQELASYLLLCKKTFVANNGKAEKAKQKELIRIYKLLQKNHIEKVIWGMQDYISDYQNTIEEKISALVKGKET